MEGCKDWEFSILQVEIYLKSNLAIGPTGRVRNDLQKASEGGRGREEISCLFDAAVDVMGYRLELSFFSLLPCPVVRSDVLEAVISVHTAASLFLGVESDLQDDGKPSFNPMLWK